MSVGLLIESGAVQLTGTAGAAERFPCFTCRPPGIMAANSRPTAEPSERLLTASPHFGLDDQFGFAAVWFAVERVLVHREEFVGLRSLQESGVNRVF